MSRSMGSAIVGEMLQLAMALETRNLQLRFDSWSKVSLSAFTLGRR